MCIYYTGNRSDSKPDESIAESETTNSNKKDTDDKTVHSEKDYDIII